MTFVKQINSWLGSETARIAIAICLLGIITCIPFRAQILHHWDSVNFALAIEHFDVRLHQPHPPGTFVIYIMLGRLLNVFLNDPNVSLVWLSVLLSGLGAAVLFLLSDKLFGRRVGLTTALLSIVSPMIWFHSEVALSYMLEFLWVPLIVYACYHMQSKSWGALLTSSLLLGLAGGVRPNTPVFIFPLWAWGVIAHKYSWKRIPLALIVMGLGVLIWFVPMVAMSGGLAEYIEIMQDWQSQHTEESITLGGIAENSIRFSMYVIYTLGLGLLTLLLATARNLRDIIISVRRDWRAQVLILWILPGAGYFSIIHLRQPGHTFTILPALLLLNGLATVALARKKGTWRQPIWIGWTASIVLVNTLFFLLGPTYLFNDTRMLFTTPSRNTIHDYDVYVANRLDAIRENFDPAETAVVANGRNLRLADFYLADFQMPSLSHQIDTELVTLAAPIQTLVIFDDAAIAELTKRHADGDQGLTRPTP